MRFLHTGDWHVGKPLRGRSRIGEQERVLEEILQIGQDGRADLVLITGDLFDAHAPSPEAERVVYSFLAELVGRGLPAVVIGGNHDHPRRLSALKCLLENIDIHIRPDVMPADAGGVVDLTASGEDVRVACLPFVAERRVVDACQLMGPERNWYEEYARKVGQICALLADGFREGSVNLLAAHLHVKGAETSGSERAVHVAHPYAVDASDFPPAAQYAALGHLHRPQQISAPCPAYYCGSPIQLDFGEQGQDKSVMLVEVGPGGHCECEPVGLSAGRRLKDLSGTLSELKRQAGGVGQDYLRVTVRLEEPVPGVADRVREILPNALEVRVDYPRIVERRRDPSLARLSPEEVFAAFYRRQHGAEAPEAVRELFRLLYQEEMANAAD